MLTRRMLPLAEWEFGPYDELMEWIVRAFETRLTPLELLQLKVPAASAGYIGQLLRSGKCRCNGEPLSASCCLRTGDRLTLPASSRLRQLTSLAPPLVIRYEDPQLLVADKPPGLATHATGAGDANLTDLLQEQLRRRGLRCRLAPVTRLDRGTSGLLAFAKGRQAAGVLGNDVMARRWHKVYLALVNGKLTGEGHLMQQVRSHGKLRAASAHYRSLSVLADWSLLVVTLETGRTHQVRQQLAAVGHPLAGDTRYGGQAIPGLPWPFLHCVRLQIPRGETLLDLSAPLPEKRLAFLREIRQPPVNGECGWTNATKPV